MTPQRMSRPPWPQIRTTGDIWIPIASGNADESSGLRVSSFLRGSGSDSAIALSFSGSRKARTNVERSVVSLLVESRMLVGIEGKYLKLGKRKADAVAVDEA